MHHPAPKYNSYPKPISNTYPNPDTKPNHDFKPDPNNHNPSLRLDTVLNVVQTDAGVKLILVGLLVLALVLVLVLLCVMHFGGVELSGRNKE